MIDRTKPEPLYYQVKNQLLRKIENGDYKVNERIPSENELVKVYDVSMITVRKALLELVQEGILYRIQGKGTYVAEPKVKRFVNLLSFTQEMKEKGMSPSAKLVRFAKETADEKISGILGLPLDSPVWVYERIRLADQQPMAFQKSILPCKMFPGLSGQLLEESQSLYKVLFEHYDTEIYRADEEYNAISIKDQMIADELGVRVGATAFLVKRTSYTKHEEAFEYAVTMLRGDRYSIKVNLIAE
ncbi:MAG: GntR family transcriptional regulator [Firmicutes bacterium]|nr:GntR family transcriptional regulator [Bacillota bacterium]